MAFSPKEGRGIFTIKRGVAFSPKGGAWHFHQRRGVVFSPGIFTKEGSGIFA